MKNIVKDWVAFCEGTKKFEDGHFYSIFLEELSEEEIKTILDFFLNSDLLIQNYKHFKAFIPTTPSTAELELLIKSDFHQKRKVLQNIETFKSFPFNPNFVFTSDFEFVNQLILDDTWTQTFHDYIDFQTILDDEKTFVLYDSLYALTSDFDMRLFIFSPLLKPNYNFEYIFKFKKLNGVYAISNDNVYFSIRQ
jgi:hypothetical protein